MTNKPAVKVYLPTEWKEKFEKQAQKKGVSLSAFMLRCAQEYSSPSAK